MMALLKPFGGSMSCVGLARKMDRKHFAIKQREKNNSMERRLSWTRVPVG